MGKIYDIHISAPRVENVELPTQVNKIQGPFYDPSPLQSIKGFAAGIAAKASEHAYDQLLDFHGAFNNLMTAGAPHTASDTSVSSARLNQFLADSQHRQVDLQNQAHSLREALLNPSAQLQKLGSLNLSDVATYPALLPLRLLDHHIDQAINNFKLPAQPTAYDVGYEVMSAALLVGSMKKGAKLTPKKPLFNADAVAVRDIAGQFTRVTRDGKTTLSLHNQKVHVQDGVVRYEGRALPAHVAEADFFSAVSLRLRNENIPVQSVETLLDFSQKKGRWSENLFTDFTAQIYATLLRSEPDAGKRRLIMASALQQTADQFPELHALDRRKPTRLALVKEGKGGPVFSARFDHGSALNVDKDLKGFTAQLNPETTAALDRLIDMVLKSPSK